MYNRQVCFAISLIGLGLSVMVLPHLRSLVMYFMAQGAVGFASAGIDVAGNVWLLEMWQENSNPYMQGMHFSYALGSTISPLICEPFLSPDKIVNGTVVNGTSVHGTSFHGTSVHGHGTGNNLDNLTIFDNTTIIPFTNISSDAFRSRIHIPYAMVSSISFLASLLLVIFYINSPYKDPLRTLSHIKPSQSIEITDESINLIPLRLPRSYFVTIISLGALILCFYAGIELNTFTYLQAFAVNIDLHLTKSTGAFMTSVVSASYTVSRGLSIFLATKFKTTTLLYFNLTMIGIGNVIVLINCNTNESGIWIGLIVMGFGFSSVFPGIYAFLEERINVTNTVCGFFMFASSLATTINPIIEGKYIESYPLVFLYINIVSLIICLILFGALHYTDRTKRNYGNMSDATPT